MTTNLAQALGRSGFQSAWEGHRRSIPVDQAFIDLVRTGAVVWYATDPAVDSPYEFGQYRLVEGRPCWVRTGRNGEQIGRQELADGELDAKVLRLVDPKILDSVFLDSVASAPLTSLERIKLSAALRAKVQELNSVPAGSDGDAERMTAIRGEIRELTRQLGGDEPYADAQAYFKANMQGQIVQTAAGAVLISGASWKELKRGMKSDGLKAALVPHVINILKTGTYGGREPLNKDRSDAFVAFHFFQKTLEVMDLIVTAGVNVGERADGSLVYGMGHEFEPRWAKRKGTELSRGQEPRGSVPNKDVAILDSIVADGGDGVNIVILQVMDKAGHRVSELEDDAAKAVPAPADPVSALAQKIESCYLKVLDGKPFSPGLKMTADKLQSAFLQRDAAALKDILNPHNKTSRAAFGVLINGKLPASVKDTDAVVDDLIGKMNAKANPPKADPNFGRSWKSKDGQVLITGYFNGNPAKYVTTLDGKIGGAPIISAAELESYIEVDERQAASREQTLAEIKGREAAEAAKSAAHEAEYAVIGGAGMARGRLIKALDKKVRLSDGRIVTIKQLVEEEVKAGATVEVKSFYNAKADKSLPERVLYSKDGTFRDEKSITKIGMDYAQSLVAAAGALDSVNEHDGDTDHVFDDEKRLEASAS